MSRFCCYCGKELEKGSEKFCPYCGKPLMELKREGGIKETEKVENIIQKEEPLPKQVLQESVLKESVSPEHVSPELVEQSRKEYQEHEKQTATTESWYLVDFIKNLTKSNNIPLFIYLILNVFLIGLIVSGLFSLPEWQGLIIGFVLYVISITIALSPLGEWILRLQTGCKKITNTADINRLEPIFREVYEKARKLNPSIPKDVRLFMNDDESINAFATGRKTVCVTRGLLTLPDEQIKATLSHEFGHLAHKDTDLILIVSIGNFIITAIITIVRVVINLMQLVIGIVLMFVGGNEGVAGTIVNSLMNMMINIFVVFAMWVWTKLGILMVMKSSRENEYGADEFAFNLGYGYELCVMLDGISGPEPKGLFKNLSSSHPNTQKRIERLQKKGVRYTR